MGARLLTAVGALTLVVAFALLIVTCASIPNTSLPLLTVDAHNDRRGATGGEIRVQFGLWGWCQHTSEVWGTHPEGCVKGNGTSGYNPAVVMRGLNEDFPSFNTAGSARDLTLGFVLPAVAIATTGVAIILAIAWLIKGNRIIYIAILTFSVLSFIFTIAAVGCVFGFCEKIRKGTPARILVWVARIQVTMSTVFHVTVHVRPRDVARFLEAAEPTIERMKREPELMHFEMYQVHDSPGTITWIEKWSEPVDWIMKHQMTKDYYNEYFDATEPFYVKPRELRVMSSLGPRYTYQKT
ncbi:hypothetical protein CGCS363_v000142 [Colletotrichum siamense]|uniref:uncharacterized protein n=1 Tax=Colletotrichum siamense TaxID=690259 RepID=UPI0018723CFB|nr:uncharacterized protein CGCS363_v000142 [Colletotrichum siamense]KAF5515407.1 hypothetical protein CGCS363_v000142 [Colletotrichum siamense]